MYLGMRDVIAHRTIEDDYNVFKKLGITAMEVRTERDLTLQFLGDEPFSIADTESKKTSPNPFSRGSGASLSSADTITANVPSLPEMTFVRSPLSRRQRSSP